MISVIIPIYNCEPFIEKCLESLFGQTLKQIEFIFVDDCSTDESYHKLTYCIENYPEVKDNIIVVRHDFNKGVAAARNTGILHATQQYIGWVDADDWVDVEMFERLYKKIKSEDSDIVWCDYINVFDSHQYYVNQALEADKFQCIRSMINGKLFGGMCNKLTKKSLYLDNNITFPDGFNICEDLRVNIQLFYYANKVSYLDGAFYHYVKYRDNTLSNAVILNSSVQSEWIENVRGIVEFVIKKNIEVDNRSLDFIKLQAKKNLLIKGESINILKQWGAIFPESNNAIWYTNYPLAYKVLGSLIKNRLWFLVDILLFFKYNLFKNK